MTNLVCIASKCSVLLCAREIDAPELQQSEASEPNVGPLEFDRENMPQISEYATPLQNRECFFLTRGLLSLSLSLSLMKAGREN